MGEIGMVARNAARNGVDALSPAGEVERLRDQVKKLFHQLDAQEHEFHDKEEALKQAIGLLLVLSRSAVGEEVHSLLDRLGREIKKDEQYPVTVKTLVTDIKDRISQEVQNSQEVSPSQLVQRSEPPSSMLLPTRDGEAFRKNPQPGKSDVTLSSPGPKASEVPASVALPIVQERELEEKIRALLSSFLAPLQIEGQKRLHDQIAVVKMMLAEGGLLHRLADVRLQFREVLEGYRNFHNTERSRLEEVLKELVGKLAEIEKNVIGGLLENYKETMADNTQFVDRLEGQVVGMQEVTQLNDLDSVRRAITLHSERMRAAIQTKRDADTALSAAFESRVRSLERQLRDANRHLSTMTERAYHDPLLDGVYNRLAFNEKLQQEIDRCQRYQQDVSLILFDMDRFKQVNDTYGHQAGDLALQTLAVRVKAALRAPDFFARFGGDEFALILPQTALPGAVIVSERIRKLLHHTKFLYETHELQVSLSLGVASLHAEDSPESLLGRADQALYLAKENGRNQVRTEEEIPSPPPSTLNKVVDFFSRKLPFRKGRGEE
jgi:diguanylate cyclase